METTYIGYMDSPMGPIRMEASDTAIRRVELVEKKGESRENEVIRKCREELEGYFRGARKTFDLPLDPKGTAWQEKVWKILEQIPYGTTTSYGIVAAKAGNPKASRAAGGAIHNNPILILIPCHRVIGKNGSLTGFGEGLDKKRYLLELEGGE